MAEFRMTMTDQFARAMAEQSSNYSPEQVKSMVYDLTVLHKEKQDLLDNLEEVRKTNDFLTKHIAEKDSHLATAKSIILEAFDQDDFSKDMFETIAAALDVELSKQYDVVITVTFSGTVTAPMGYDLDNLNNVVDFSATENRWADDISVDLFEDGMEIRSYKESN